MTHSLISLAIMALALAACADPQCGDAQRKIGNVCVPTDAGRSVDGQSAETTPEDDEDQERSDATPGKTPSGQKADATASEGLSDAGRSGDPDPDAGSHATKPAEEAGSTVGDSGNKETPATDGSQPAPVHDGGKEPPDDACSGNECMPSDECANDPCPSGGKCTNTAGGRVCDYCDPNPCQNGGTCANQGDGFICSCPEDHPGELCEQEVCASVTVRTRADVEASALCAKIDGDLTIAPNFAEISADDFPNLREVTGQVIVKNDAAQALSKVTLSALATIRVRLALEAMTLTKASFPALASIGDSSASAGLIVVTPNLSELDLAALEEVQGTVQLLAPKLCSANVRRVRTIGKNLSMANLYNLPYSSTAALRTATAGTVMAGNVGCCTVTDAFQCTATTSAADCTCP